MRSHATSGRPRAKPTASPPARGSVSCRSGSSKVDPGNCWPGKRSGRRKRRNVTGFSGIGDASQRQKDVRCVTGREHYLATLARIIHERTMYAGGGGRGGARGMGPLTTADSASVTRQAVPTPWLLCRRRAGREGLNRTPSPRPPPRPPPGHRLADWTAALRRNIPRGRQLLRRLLVGRIVFTPGPTGVAFEAACSLGRLLAGLACAKTLVTPGGFALVGTLLLRGEIAA